VLRGTAEQTAVRRAGLQTASPACHQPDLRAQFWMCESFSAVVENLKQTGNRCFTAMMRVDLLLDR